VPVERSTRAGRPRREVAATLPTSILDSAQDLFLGGGFARTSMDQIAERAGVSKRTVYAHFGNKDSLLSAVVDRLVDATRSELADLSASARTDESARQRVTYFCRSLLDLGLTTEALQLYRLIITDSPRSPEIATHMSREIENGIRLLAQLMDAEVSAGNLRDTDGRRSARLLTSMLNGEPLRAALFGDVWDAELRDAWVAAVVDTLPFNEDRT
jgi:TetR/AcrR family transcriptional repressor of mexJK operon